MVRIILKNLLIVKNCAKLNYRVFHHISRLFFPLGITCRSRSVFLWRFTRKLVAHTVTQFTGDTPHSAKTNGNLVKQLKKSQLSFRSNGRHVDNKPLSLLEWRLETSSQSAEPYSSILENESKRQIRRKVHETSRILAFISSSFDTESNQPHSSISSAWLLISAAYVSARTTPFVGQNKCTTCDSYLPRFILFLTSFLISRTVSSE